MNLALSFCAPLDLTKDSVLSEIPLPSVGPSNVCNTQRGGLARFPQHFIRTEAEQRREWGVKGFAENFTSYAKPSYDSFPGRLKLTISTGQSRGTPMSEGDLWLTKALMARPQGVLTC